MKLAAKPCLRANPRTKVDLVLPHARLRNGGLCGDVHGLAGVIKLREERIKGVERPQRQNLPPETSLARARRGRRLQIIGAVVDQVELQLGRHNGGPAMGCVAFQHLAQSMSRVALEGRAVLQKHPHGQQGGRGLEPRHRHVAALCRHKHPVAVAGREDQRAVFDFVAPDVHVQHRHRHARPLSRELIGKTRRHPLAARLPIQVRHGDAQGAYGGVVAEKITHGATGSVAGGRAICAAPVWGKWWLIRPNRPSSTKPSATKRVGTKGRALLDATGYAGKMSAGEGGKGMAM